jgi:signal transduction histidine kinase
MVQPQEVASRSECQVDEEIMGLRRQVADLQAQLDRAERLATLGAMSGAVAHELNNMLTPLMSYAGLALGSPDDAALTQKALEKTLQTAERAGEVTAALLRSTAAPATEDRSTCNLAQAIADALAAMPRHPERDGIEVLIDIAPDLEVCIGRGAMQQVAMNLIINACDAMRPGPGTLAFSASVLHTNHFTNLLGCSEIVLRVADTGPGIPVEIAEQAFEPLVTTKSPNSWDEQTGTGSGSGLGLTICRKLITDSGGSIAVRSAPGLGTCFSIRLIRAAALAETAKAA